MMNNAEDLYNLFFEQFLPTILENQKNGGGRWPMPIFEQSFSVSNFSAPVVVEEFMSTVQKLNEKGMTDVQIGQKYRYPSRLARFQHLFAGRYLWLDKYDPITVAHKFISILSTMYPQNLFCQGKKNLIYTEESIANEYGSYLNLGPARDINLEIASLERLFYLLSESFSPRFVNTHFEFSGQYKVGKNWLILKEYHDLQPDFIPIHFEYSFHTVTIIHTYGAEIDYQVDIMCRPQASNQSMPEPKQSILLVDNRLVNDLTAIRLYQKQVMATMELAVNYVAGLRTKEQIVTFNTGMEILTLLSPISAQRQSLIKAALENFRNSEFQNRSDQLNAYVKATPRDENGWRGIFDPRIKQRI